MTDVNKIVKAVSEATYISVEQIMSPHRGKPAACRARWMAMHVYQRWGSPSGRLSLTEVGRAFDRERTSVRHGLERFHEETERSPALRDRLATVLARVTRH